MLDSDPDVGGRTTPPAGEDDRLVAIGAALAVVGLLALVVAFGPFAYDYGKDPLWLGVAAFLLPVGLAVFAVGLLRLEDPFQRQRSGSGNSSLSEPDRNPRASTSTFE